MTQKVPLLKLAAVAIVLMPLPLFLLSPTTPWPAAWSIIAAFAFFTPLVNAPIIGILTVRTPVELRPKVMTAVMTVATMAGPFGFIAAGYALRHVTLGSLLHRPAGAAYARRPRVRRRAPTAPRRRACRRRGREQLDLVGAQLRGPRTVMKIVPPTVS